MPLETANIRHLEMFQMMMQMQSVTGAAQALGVTQPAVSHAMKALEGQLGFLLFARTRGRIVPTPEAVLLLAEVERLFARLHGFSSRVAELRSRRGGFLTVATVASCSANLLPAAFHDFAASWPEVECRLLIHAASQIAGLVEQERIDLGFCFAAPGDSTVAQQPLLTTQLVACLHRDDPRTGKASLGLEDLMDGPVFIPGRDTVPGRLLRDFIDQRRLGELRAVEINHAGLAIGLVARHGGVGLMEPLSLGNAPWQGLVLRPFHPAIRISFSAFHSLHRQPTPVADGFIAAMRAVLAQEAVRLTALGMTAFAL
jgi:DNA-binding transcriptional LysR family regulator